jgi:hypothetical protein
VPSGTALLGHRSHYCQPERLRAADQWTDAGLVFTTEFGRPVEPRNLLRVVQSAGKPAGVEGVGVHTRRRWAGSKPVCTYRRWPTCSGTAVSELLVTCTAIQAMTPPARLSMGGAAYLACDPRVTVSPIPVARPR